MKPFYLDHQTIRKIYDLEDQDAKLPLSDAIFCAEDVRRNRKFFEAIKRSLAKLRHRNKEQTLVVVDAGSGTGILGLYALRNGADKCYFLEQNPYSLAFSKKLIQRYQFAERAEFIKCDATEVLLPESFDLLVSETLTSGLVAEDFPKILNHLRQFGKPQSIIIPEALEITLSEKDHQNQLRIQHQLFINSYQGISQKNIKLRTSPQQLSKLEWETKAFLAEGVEVESGECMSFLNPKVTAPNINHPVFSFEFSEK